MWICIFRQWQTRERKLLAYLDIFCVRLLQVCSFYQSGQCEGLNEWNGQQVRLSRFSFIIEGQRGEPGDIHKQMDSIQLLSETAGKFGQQCSVSVSTGDTYSGNYRGFCESTRENPLTLRLGISEGEAKRIGKSWLREIGVPYDVITNIQF